MASYNWTGPGGWTSDLQNPTRPNATGDMAGTYTSTATDSNGCSDDDTTNVVVEATIPQSLWGRDSSGQCNVESWADIVQVAAGGSSILFGLVKSAHTVGLRNDGTVIAVGDNGYGQCDVGNWTDIVQISTCDWHTVGVKSDGTVVAVGENSLGQCNITGWDLD